MRLEGLIGTPSSLPSAVEEVIPSTNTIPLSVSTLATLALIPARPLD